MVPIRSVLIIQTAFIGDVILATALVESLRKAFPELPIDFLVRKGNESLIHDNPQIRKVLIFDKSRKFRNLIGIIQEIRKSKYDYVINVQRFATTGMMTVFSGARKTIGFDKNPLSLFFSRRVPHVQEGVHEVQRNNKLIEPWVGQDAGKPRLYPSKSQYDKVAQFKSGPYITVSPASVWYTKQLKKEKWIEFLSSLPANLKVFLLGADTDRELCEVIKTETKGVDVINLAGNLCLLESAALMEHAIMNYVNDSAPMHLASARNAPVTAVFCSTIPAFGFGPLSDRSFIVETEEKLTCRPCGLHGHRACPEGHFKCALTINKTRLSASLS